jgi:hypothetical protein
MSEHTKEPWNVGFIEDVPGEKYWVIGGDSLLFARLPSNHPVMLANAERIVACVNYCAGIPTDVLTTYSPPEDGLRAAARECLEVVDEAYDATGYVKVARTSVQRMRLEAALWQDGREPRRERPDGRDFYRLLDAAMRHAGHDTELARALEPFQFDAKLAAALGGKE